MTGYLPLAEAAQYVTNKTGKECEPDALLRAGVHGALLIAAAFSGQMRNLTAHKNEDYSGLLTIPPRYLLEIDTHGKAIIERAFSLDGKNCYAPLKIRTREQLRVLVSELDRFIPYIVEITPQHQAAPTEAPKSETPPTYRPRIGWKIALFDAWPTICRLYARTPTAAEAVRYLQTKDQSGVILAKTDCGSLWWKPQRGKAKEVDLHTVENTISDWRTRGVLPA